MKAKKIVSIVLLVGGIIVLILSLTADIIGISGNHGFGAQQKMAIIAGAVVAAAGLVMIPKKK
jgi:hypothetical protein